ncbi:MAG: formimidoylglutamate deiminase [Propionibacteriaceae bacterium]|jgi:formiminoglutamate deiminase|nr:formimidoylglutamate deiminase [Propionibacteriaceae bacterium]
MTYWAKLLYDGQLSQRVTIEVSAGQLTSITADTEPPPGATRLGFVTAGIANAHSHAFHRLLRGQTHAGGGDFWQWRQAMYASAATLTPEALYQVAQALYAEMLQAGYTAVGEFHYLHHQPDGLPYPDHEMERALAQAAQDVGIRLLLLDTCYLHGGIGQALAGAQLRFGDGSAEGYLERHLRLTAALEEPLVRVGAAIHSVRAVEPTEMAEVAAEVPGPLHIHLSEQPAENQECLEVYGRSPTQLLAEQGLLSRRLAVVHATQLADGDIATLGEAGVTAVFCPSTEADLGDGIGPAKALAAAGVSLAIGSDEHAVVDALGELRALEYGQRLASGQRGRFTPAALWQIGSANGYRSLGLGAPLTVGGPADFIEIDLTTPRTHGADPLQTVMVATAADVTATVVAGQLVHDRKERR